MKLESEKKNMKKIIKKISSAIQIILLTPVKLPAKVLNVLKYIGLGMGIIESVMVDSSEDDAGTIKPPDRIVKYDLETGKEIMDETE